MGASYRAELCGLLVVVLTKAVHVATTLLAMPAGFDNWNNGVHGSTHGEPMRLVANTQSKPSFALGSRRASVELYGNRLSRSSLSSNKVRVSSRSIN